MRGYLAGVALIWAVVLVLETARIV